MLFKFYVKNNKVTILVNEAEYASDINVDEAKLLFTETEALLKKVAGVKEKIELTNLITKAKVKLRIVNLDKNKESW
jgi:F0F1-type ATP synthase epsilon subunit